MQDKMTKYAFLYRKCLHFYIFERIIQTSDKTFIQHHFKGDVDSTKYLPHFRLKPVLSEYETKSFEKESYYEQSYT